MKAFSGYDPVSLRNLGFDVAGLSLPFRYSAEGEESDSTYLLDSQRFVQLVANRGSQTPSGNAFLCTVNASLAGNHAQVSSAATADITGDIDIRARVSRVDSNSWSGTTSGHGFVSKWGNSDGLRQYRFYLVGGSGNGFLTFAWSPTGLDADIITVTCSTSLTSRFSGAYVAGICYVRVTLDVDDGAGHYVVKFWTSTDGITWTQLGTTTTGGATTSLISTAAKLAVGATRDGNGDLSREIFYYADVRDNILDDGTGKQAVFDPSVVAKLATSWVSVTGETWNVFSAGDHGAVIAAPFDFFQMTQGQSMIHCPFVGLKYAFSKSGSTTDWFSAPHASAFNTAADLDVVCKISAVANLPFSTGYTFFAKYINGGQRSFKFGVTSSGLLSATLSGNGTTSNQTDSSTALTGYNAWDDFWVRFTYRMSDRRVQFFHAPDAGDNTPPSSWTQLGTDRTSTQTSIFAGTDDLRAMAGDSVGFRGRLYYAELRTSIGGAPVARFDPSGYVNGASFVAPTTGETWTMNPSAARLTIVQANTFVCDGADDYMKMSPYQQAQPLAVHLVTKINSTVGQRKLFDGQNSNDSFFITRHDTDSIGIGATVGTRTSPNATAAFPDKRRGVISGIFNGTTSKLSANRGAQSTGDVGSSGVRLLMSICSQDGTNTASQNISEWWITIGNLSEHQIKTIQGYLRAKWGIHP